MDKVEINGVRYVPDTPLLLCIVAGVPIYRGKIIWSRKDKGYHIVASHLQSKKSGVIFVGQDGRTIPIKDVLVRG